MADVTFVPDFSAFIAEVDRLEKRQTALKNVTESFGKSGAQAYTALERAAKRAAAGPSEWTRALQENTAAQAAASKSMNEFRGKINLGAESLGKAGAALGALNPALGTAAGGFQKLIGVVSAGVSGLELFGSAAKGALAIAGGPLALAASVTTLAVAAAYEDYATNAEKAEKAEKDAKEETEKAIEAHEKLTKALRDQRIEQDRLAGRITDTDAKTQEASNTLKDEYTPRLEAAKKALDEARKAEDEWRRGMGPMDQALESDKVKLEELERATGDAAVAYSDLKTAFKAVQRVQKDNIITTDEQTKGEKDRETAARKAAEEERKRAKAAEERRKEQESAAKDALDYLAKEEEAERAYFAMLGEQQAERDRAVEASRQKELDDFNAMLKAEGEADAKALAEGEAAYEKSFAEREKREQDYISSLTGSIGSASAVFGQFYDNMTADTENMTDEQKKSALRMWNIQKALAVAEIEMNTIKSVSAALATPPAPNLLLGGLALGLGTAQAMAANTEPTPTFDDTPGPVYAATGQSAMDRAPVSLHRDDILIAGKTPESVVSQAAAMGSGRSRPRLGPQLARVPVGALLTRDVERATRGRLPR